MGKTEDRLGPFVSPWAKLARAKKHIDDLERERDTFRDTKQWSNVAEINPHTRHKELKIVFAGSVNFVEFSLIASDALGNLRSVLDHACGASARASGYSDPRSAYFPIGGTPRHLADNIKRNCKHLHPDVVSLLQGFHPYKTGNPHPFLWALSNARNVEEHSLIGPYSASIPVVVIRYGSDRPPRKTDWFRPIWRPENNEIVYAVGGPEINTNDYMQITPDISFAEGEYLIGNPAVSMLHLLTHVVESVLVAIERETRRLFPQAFRGPQH